MNQKKFQKLSVVALIISLLPSVFLHITLTDGVRSAWAGVNIFCIFVGFIISVICVKNRDSRNVINIISTTISSFWVLLMGGIVVLALFIGFVQ